RAEDGIRAFHVTGVQTCALPICGGNARRDGRGDATGPVDPDTGGATGRSGGGDGVNSTGEGRDVRTDRDRDEAGRPRNARPRDELGRASWREREGRALDGAEDDS